MELVCVDRSVVHRKERDSESALDYFVVRHFSGAQGRFTSSDPLVASAKARHPQTWNRYSYALNNPLRFTGPTGPYGYAFQYNRLLNDSLSTMQYPSGRIVSHAQDDAGRVIQVQDGSKTYAQGIGYTAHGAITQAQLGNQLVEQWPYTSRLQRI